MPGNFIFGQMLQFTRNVLHFSANTPWLVTGYGKYGLIFCTWRIWVMEKFEIRLGFASPKGLATLIASVKLQKSCQVGVLPDTRKCYNSDQITCANGY